MTQHNRAYLSFALSVNYAAMACMAISVNLIPVFLTTLGVDLGGPSGLTNEQLGRIGGVTFVGLVLGVLLAGPLADRIGPKPFTLLGNLMVAAGLAVLGLAGTYPLVLAAVFVMGLGAGILDMILSPIVCALQPHRKASAMNWLHSFYCTGAVATILIAAMAMKAGLSWRTLALWMTIAPLLVAAGFAWLQLPPMVAHGQVRSRVRDLVRVPYFLAALAAIFLAGGTELGMAQWLPAYAEKSLHYSAWTGGIALVVFSVAMVAGRMLAGIAGHWIDPVKMMMGCCVASVAMFIVACFSPWGWLALGGAMAAGLAGSCLWPTMLAVSADRFPRGGVSMFALLAALGNAGGIFAPWTVGIIADHAPMNWGLATAALCPLGMVIILSRMRASAPAITTLQAADSSTVA